MQIKKRKAKLKRKRRGVSRKKPNYRSVWEGISNRITDTQRLEDIKVQMKSPSDDPHVLAEAVINQLYRFEGVLTLKYYKGVWYSWRENRYDILTIKELRPLINKTVREILNIAASNKQVSRQLVDNVVSALEGLCIVEGYFEMPFWLDCAGQSDEELLSMDNGLLDLQSAITEDEATIYELSPNWFCMSYWDYRYDPSAECIKWKTFLKQVLKHPDERKLLQEYLGYCLTFDTSYHKALILVGEGANGKSVVTEVATHLIGINNVSHVSLESFGEQFALSATIGKLANIVSEISRTRSVDEGILKAIISGDRIKTERKYHDPAFSRPTARLIFATNEIPNFNDRSGGLWRRLLFLNFTVTIPEEKQNRSLARDICETELSGIFNWALVGLKRLKKNKCFTIPKSSKLLLQEQKNVSNPARQFLSEHYKEVSGEKVICEDVYQSYKQWCFNQSLHPLTTQQFGQEVRRVFPGVERKQLRFNKSGKGVRLYYYIGLASKS